MEEIGNGISSEPGNKRKRKAPMDEDIGSPARDGSVSTPAERSKAKMTQQQNAPAYNILSLFSERELAMYSNNAHVAAVHFLAASKRAKLGQGPSTNGTSADGDDGTESAREDAGGVEMERTTSQGVHVTRSTRTNGSGGLTLLGELSEKAATRPNLPYAILGNYHSRPNGSSVAPPPPPLMPEEIEDDLARFDKLANKPRGWMDTKLVNELSESMLDYQQDPLVVQSSSRFSTLHPDFPPEMDVHLVRLRARNDA